MHLTAQNDSGKDADRQAGADETVEEVTPAMRRAGSLILWELRGEVESELLVERVYLAMRIVHLQETAKS